MIKRNKNKIFNILLALGFIGLFAVYFSLNKDDFKVLLEIKAYYIFAIALLQICVIFVNAIFFIVIFKAFDLNIDTKEGLNTSIITAIGNYFTPFRGGLGIRAVYLKKKYGFSYSKFISTVAGNYVVVFLINSLIALFCLGTLALQSKKIDPILVLVFAGMFIILLLIVLFPIPSSKIPETKFGLLNKFINKVKLVIEGWNVLAGKRSLIIKLSILTLINAFIGIFLYYIELKSIGTEVNLLYAIIYSSISAISLLLSLTPGSLGIRESLLVLFQSSLMLGTSEILASSVVDRVIYFFVMLILLIITTLSGYVAKNKGIFKKEK